MNIMQKELDHTKRLKQLRVKENADIESKRSQRDVRVQSARVKKYYDDYSTRMKSSMLKNKTKEEQVSETLTFVGEWEAVCGNWARDKLLVCCVWREREGGRGVHISAFKSV